MTTRGVCGMYLITWIESLEGIDPIEMDYGMLCNSKTRNRMESVAKAKWWRRDPIVCKYCRDCSSSLVKIV